MELKEGYKQTDVGVIPVEWELGDLHLSMTYTHGKAHEPFVAEWGKYTIVNSKFIATEGAVKKVVTSNFCPAQQGDVLMVLSDLPNGRALAKTYTAGSEASMLAVNQRVVRLRPNPMHCDGSYAGYAINRHPYFLKFDDGVTQTHLLNKHLDEFKFPLPPIKEQRAIAEVLSDVDAEIESLARRHEKLVNQKQGLSEELLSGRTRLVEPKSKGFKQTEVGVIPEDWEVRQLRHLLEIGHGRSQKEVEEESGPYPIYGTGGLMGFATDYLHPGPTVMIGRKGTIDKPRFSEGPVWTVDTLFYCDCKKQLTPRFAFELFQTIDWRSYNEASGVPSLSSKTILSIEVAIPPVDEQQAITEVLCDVDTEIQAVAKLKAKVQAKKEGLMQTLLTGKIRLT